MYVSVKWSGMGACNLTSLRICEDRSLDTPTALFPAMVAYSLVHLPAKTMLWVPLAADAALFVLARLALVLTLPDQHGHQFSELSREDR